MSSLTLHTPHFAGKPPTRWLSRSLHAAAFGAILVVLVLGVRAAFDHGLQPRILELQVNELAARVKLGDTQNTDFQDVAGTGLAPEVAAMVTKFKLKELKSESFHRLTQDRKLLVASDVGDNWVPTTRADEPMPGLYWQGSALRHKWGGDVAVYVGGPMVLVSFSNVPQRLCDEAFLADNAGYMSYVFACNGRLTAVERGSSWNVTAADMYPLKQSTPN